MGGVRGIGLATLLLAASACGGRAPALAAPSASALVPSAERLLIEGASASELVDAATGGVLATLPAGVVSPTGDLIVRLSLDPSGNTQIGGVDLAGRKVLGLGLAGRYELPAAYGPAPSGFSANGKWLVLVERAANESHFALIDVARGAVAKTVTLSSRFTFDAVHNDGSAMYLIEHPSPGSTKYNVRFYDLAAGVLKPDIIFDKVAISSVDPTIGLMDGIFHVSVAPTSGDWSYGLYMRPNGSPFVHALNVPGHYAHCIVDVAGKWTRSSMFSMALSPDGRGLFVVDTAGGNATRIDGLTQKVVRKASFGTRDGSADPAAASAAVSPDGSRLYATAPRGIVMLQTTDLALRAWLAPDVAARSLAVSADGSVLYALAGSDVVVVDAGTGAILARYAAPDGARAVHLLPRDPAARR